MEACAVVRFAYSYFTYKGEINIAFFINQITYYTIVGIIPHLFSTIENLAGLGINAQNIYVKFIKRHDNFLGSAD